MSRFIQVLQKDVVTKPDQWKDAGPGKFIKLSNKAKNVYSVLSVIAFSAAGNAEGKFAKNVGKLGKGWFWTSHTILQQLTGSCQKTVQRAIKELEKAGFIGYHPARKNGHQCFFKIKRIKYNYQEDYEVISSKSNPVEAAEPASTHEYSSGRKYVNKGYGTYKGPIELDIPYKEGVLFRRSRNTHDHHGCCRDIEGNFILGSREVFSRAEQLMEKEGEQAFLEYVIENKIQNHLVPKYRTKLAKMKN